MINLKEASTWGNEAAELIKKRQAKQTVKFGGRTIEVNKHEVIDFNAFKLNLINVKG